MNCKPGQKAVIINSLERENIGRIVTVVEDWNDRATHEGIYWPPLADLVGDHMWLVESGGSPIAYNRLPGSGDEVIRIQSGPYGDSWLRPLTDVEEPATEEAVTETPRHVEHAE